MSRDSHERRKDMLNARIRFLPNRFLLPALLLLPCLFLRAADVTVYAVYKRQVYIQTNEGPPVFRCCPYMFDALVELSGSNSVTSAMLGDSINGTTSLTPGDLDEFLPRRAIAWTSEGFPDQKALEAKWPGGDYVFSIFGANDGAKTSVLQLSGDLYPTNPPHLLNFAAAQAIDASKDFTLRWSALEGGTTNDFSFVLIRKAGDGTPVSNTPFLAETNALDGTVSAIIIPAGTLAPGAQYDGYVRFDRVVMRDTTSYPGAIGQASYGSGTHFTLKTLSDTH